MLSNKFPPARETLPRSQMNLERRTSLPEGRRPRLTKSVFVQGRSLTRLANLSSHLRLLCAVVYRLRQLYAASRCLRPFSPAFPFNSTVSYVHALTLPIAARTAPVAQPGTRQEVGLGSPGDTARNFNDHVIGSAGSRFLGSHSGHPLSRSCVH